MRSKRHSVVIVDDNDMMRTVLRAMLRSERYDIVGEARNGVQAVDMVSRLKPDIVCMDVLMPEKNGIEAMADIKVERPETEIIMITGSADPDTVQEAIMNGAAGFIIKPFNAARVIDTLAKVAARLRHRR